MTYEEWFNMIVHEESHARSYALEISKEADKRKIPLPTLIKHLAEVYGSNLEAAVEKELMDERW